MSKGFVCANCKEYTKSGHLVPASCGDPSFWLCETKDQPPRPTHVDVEVMPGIIRRMKIED